MKYIRVIFAIIILFAFIMPVVAQERAKTSQEIKTIADPILDNILDGFKYDDYLIYSRDFDPTLKVVGSRTKFFKVSRYIQTRLGNYLHRDYMGYLNKGDVIIVLWKGKFDKTKNDVLIKLVLKNERKRYNVAGLWLQ